MAASLQNRHPEGNPFEERVLDKLESIDGRLRRIEGKAPRPVRIPPPDREKELAAVAGCLARDRARRGAACRSPLGDRGVKHAQT